MPCAKLLTQAIAILWSRLCNLLKKKTLSKDTTPDSNYRFYIVCKHMNHLHGIYYNKLSVWTILEILPCMYLYGDGFFTFSCYLKPRKIELRQGAYFKIKSNSHHEYKTVGHETSFVYSRIFCFDKIESSYLNKPKMSATACKDKMKETHTVMSCFGMFLHKSHGLFCKVLIRLIFV